MFVRYYVNVDRPIEQCREALTRDPQSWLPNLVEAAQEPADEILARVGFSVLTMKVQKQVAITLGEPVALRDWLHLPVHWHASPAEALFPTFDGEIQLVPIDPAVTKVAVAGTYQAPLGDVGRTVDNLVLHTAAEATVKDFAEGLARHLRAEPAPAANAKAV